MWFRKKSKGPKELLEHLADLLLEKAALESLSNEKANVLLNKAVYDVPDIDDVERPSEEAISAYILGEASQQEQAEVEKALTASRRFRYEFMELSEGINELLNLETDDVIDQSPQPRKHYSKHKTRVFRPVSKIPSICMASFTRIVNSAKAALHSIFTW